MTVEDAIRTKAIINYLDKIFEGSHLGKKNRDKVVNFVMVSESGDPVLKGLYECIRSKQYGYK